MSSKETSNILKAALWMSGAILSFTTMAVAGRAAAFDLDTFEIMFYRSCIGFLVVLAVSSVAGTRRQIRAQKLGLHFIRNLAHFSGQNLWFYAITVIPLAQVFALEFTSPLWVLLLSPFILGEKLTSARILAGILGFIGILIVARPSPESINPGIVTAALAAIGFALSALFTRRLTRTESITCILFWLTLMQIGFGLIAAGYDGDMALPSTQTLPWLVLIGFAGLLAHFCLTSALAIAPATVVVPIDFIRLPAVAIIGALVYGEALDLWVFVGALVIFGANYWNIWMETRAKRATA
ncbi:MAG: EamA family transporter [Rhodobacteraceae bacterium]|jgi:drug/metabolite transporter (DMT)-like permease|nr:EamA family transporter [Paracoccaceae bacterium]